MKKISRIIIVAAIILCVLNNSYAMGQWLSKPKPKVAADFSLYDLNGNQVSLADYKGKKQLILFFWTTWCPHCRRQIGSLNSLHKELKNKNVVILAIDVGESTTKIQSFIKNRPISFPILLDKDTDVAASYAVSGVPAFVIVDSDGSIKFHEHYLPKDIEKILFGK